MAAEARAGIERHEAERFRFGSVDDFPDVDSHPLKYDLQLVDQSDVHRAKDILEQFR